MKILDHPNGTRFQLTEDLYHIERIGSDAQYVYHTKAEVDNVVSLSLDKGTVLVLESSDPDEIHLRGEDDDIHIGIDENTPMDVYEVIPVQRFNVEIEFSNVNVGPILDYINRINSDIPFVSITELFEDDKLQNYVKSEIEELILRLLRGSELQLLPPSED